MYENQHLSLCAPIINEMTNTWIVNRSPIANGCFNCEKIIVEVKIIVLIIKWRMFR